MKKVKTKVLTIILSVMLVFASLSGTMIFANANTETNTGTTTKTVATSTKPVHTHSYKWVVTKKSTLTKTGKKVYKCSSCGKVAKTATVAKLKKLSTPTGLKYSVKSVKKASDTCYIMSPRVTVKFNKVKNATGYKIQYKYEGWKNYKTKVVKNNSYTFISFGQTVESTKYYVKVAAITDKEGYANSSYTKAKTIKLKPVEVIDVCPKCGWKKGKGKGYCETFVSEVYCSHCGKFVPDDTCHHCTIPNTVKNFYKYDLKSGKTWTQIVAEMKKNK